MEMGDDVSVNMDVLLCSASSASSASSSSVPLCRICHEEEESSNSLEAPCSCSGTVKYAHRECIQRWCIEKGDTVCEICLQNFEPGYTVPKKARLADVAVTIRESLEAHRQLGELQRPRLMAIVAAEGENSENLHAECSAASERSAACWRSIAIIFTMLLLARHLLAIIGGTEHYGLTLSTLLVVRASGIIVPVYIMIRTIEAIKCLKWRHQHRQGTDVSSDAAAVAYDSNIPRMII